MASDRDAFLAMLCSDQRNAFRHERLNCDGHYTCCIFACLTSCLGLGAELDGSNLAGGAYGHSLVSTLRRASRLADACVVYVIRFCRSAVSRLGKKQPRGHAVLTANAPVKRPILWVGTRSGLRNVCPVGRDIYGPARVPVVIRERSMGLVGTLQVLHSTAPTY